MCYLAARLQTAWEDASIVSLHGREENFIQTVSRSARTFLLLGGKDTGSWMLQKLREYGLDDVTVRAGSRLSYPDEKIISGRPSELSDKDVEGLCTALIENPRPENRGEPHIRDDAFIRGKVPMTKEEVRAVSLARLNLTGDAVVYDVGAGTGSVSVEAARCSDRIRCTRWKRIPGLWSCLRRTGESSGLTASALSKGRRRKHWMIWNRPPTYLSAAAAAGCRKS